MINRARVECQSHRLTVEDPVTVEYITRYIATLKQVALWIICGCGKATQKISTTSWERLHFSLLCLQRYTQSNGRRPFGISALIVGFDYDGTPRLYQTDPSGTYHAWKVSTVLLSAPLVIVLLLHRWTEHFLSFSGGKKANAIGRSAKTVREFLEKNYTDEAIAGDNETIKLAIKALLEARSVWKFLSNISSLLLELKHL